MRLASRIFVSLGLVALGFLLTSVAAFADGNGYTTAVLADSPYAYYKMQEAAGATVAVDSSGNGRNGTYNRGGGITLGGTGPFPGGTTSVTLGSNGSGNVMKPVQYTGTNGITIEVWAAAVGVGGNYQELWVTDATTNSYNFYRHSPGSGCGGGVVCYLQQAIQWESFGYYGSAAWTDYALVLSTTSGSAQPKLYINGVLTSTLGSQTIAPPVSATGEIAPLGDVSYAAFYTSALTATQLLAHYNAGIAAPTATPTPTNTPTPTLTPTPTPTNTFTPTPTPTPTNTPVPTSTFTPTPTRTAIATATATPNATPNSFGAATGCGIRWPSTKTFTDVGTQVGTVSEGNSFVVTSDGVFFDGVAFWNATGNTTGATGITLWDTASGTSLWGQTYSAIFIGYHELNALNPIPLTNGKSYTLTYGIGTGYDQAYDLTNSSPPSDSIAYYTQHVAGGPSSMPTSISAGWAPIQAILCSSEGPNTIVNVTGHVCVRALILDDTFPCKEGDIAATRAVIGFSDLSVADAATIGTRGTLAVTDDNGAYSYSVPWTTGNPIYFQFQGSPWCPGCTGYNWRPTGGYQGGLVNRNNGSFTGDFVVDAQLARGTQKLGGATLPNGLGFMGLTGGFLTTVEAGEAAFAATYGVSVTEMSTFLARFAIAPATTVTIPSPSVIGIPINGSNVITSLVTTIAIFFINPDPTYPSELVFPDNGARITLAPNTTQVVTINPATQPKGVAVLSGAAVAADTIQATGTNPTPQAVPTPNTSATPTTPGSNAAPTDASPGTTTCDFNIFTLWSGLGPLLMCVLETEFVPTLTLQDLLQPTIDALQTKIGFADIADLNGWVTGILPTVLTGTQFSNCIPFIMPSYTLVGGVVTTGADVTTPGCWTLDGTDSIGQAVKTMVSLALIVWAIDNIIAGVKKLMCSGGNDCCED